MTRFVRLLALVRLGRPQFLAGGFLLHGLGAAIAFFQGAPSHPAAFLWGQAAITSIQLMAHYSNDYFDLDADLANTTPAAWSGGSRVLPEGALPAWTALAAAIGLSLCAVAAILVLGLVVRPGLLTWGLLASALLLAWGYSAPPLRFHSRGLGELAVAVLVTGLTPLVGYYLQAGRLDWLPLLAAGPLACLQFAMLLVIEFPDAAGDAAVGKKTLVVRLGGSRAASLHVAVLLAVYALLPLLVRLGLPLLAASAVALTAPVAAWQAWRMLRGGWAHASAWSWLSTASVGLLLSAATGELAAFVWLIAHRVGVP
jgi:1,4-dihydroxy-2-naphthoate octaprenyltransferase